MKDALRSPLLRTYSCSSKLPKIRTHLKGPKSFVPTRRQHLIQDQKKGKGIWNGAVGCERGPVVAFYSLNPNWNPGEIFHFD